MAYVDTPLSAENQDVSQPRIRANFAQANTSFGIDHYNFADTTAKNGTHKKVTLTNSAAPGFANGDGALYAALRGGQSWPVWQNALGSTPLLSSVTSSAANGYASLPGNLLIQWGTATTTGTTTVVTFPKAFSSAPFSVVATSKTVTTFINVETFTTTQFTLGRAGIDTPVCWIAIGAN